METLCSMVVESFWLASAARTTIFTEMLVNGFPAGNGSISCCEPVPELLLLLSILAVKPLEQERASKVPSSTPQLPVWTDTTIRFSSPAYSSQSCEALLRATAGFTLVTVKRAVVVVRGQSRSSCFVVMDNWVSRYLPSPPATQESLGVQIKLLWLIC